MGSGGTDEKSDSCLSISELGHVCISHVIAKERTSLWIRREGKDSPSAKENAPPSLPELFGVALSGGGIRSASFCLGALQALDAFGAVKRIDYLSTVSGGGYIGAGMVAAMTRSDSSTFPYSVGSDASSSNDIKDSEPVSHLRDHSRYLIPHGIFDVLMSLAVVGRGIAVNLFLTLMVVMPLATLTVMANPTMEDLHHSVLIDLAGYYLNISYLSWPSFLQTFTVTKILSILLPAYLVLWGWKRSLEERNSEQWRPGKDAVSSKGTKFALGIGTYLIFSVFFELQGPILAWLADSLTVEAGGQKVVPAVLASLVAFVTATASLRTWLIGWINKGLSDPQTGAKLRSILSKSVLLVAGMVVPFLVYASYLGISLWGIARLPFGDAQCRLHEGYFYPYAPSFVTSFVTTWVVGLGVGAMLIWSLKDHFFDKESGSNWKLFKKRFAALGRLKKWIAALSVASFVVFFLSAMVATRCGYAGSLGIEYIVVSNYFLVTLLVFLMGWRFTANANSLHSLYRDRLNVAFRLHKEALKGQNENGSPIALEELSDAAPYLLLNASLNARMSADLSNEQGAQPTENRTNRGHDPVKRGRRADFFLFSKHYIGSDSTLYTPTAKMTACDRQLNLASAVAISGAAFSSNMGRANIDVLTPSLALLNVRLGYWLNNPRYCPMPNDGLPAHLPWHDFFNAYLLAEAFGLLRTDSSKIYVTDGGHVDNLGLYSLLRRRCDHIIVIDAEADSALDCGALVDVQRFARIDLGVLIKIDWVPMQTAALARRASPKDSMGSSKGLHVDKTMPVHDCHFAIGKIFYPNDEYGPAKEGLLIYIKPVVTGDEPDYVLDYERRFPDFPQETTADQFFSEEQMEAYRSLGFHAMERTLKEEAPVSPKDKEQSDATKGRNPATSGAASVSTMKNRLGGLKKTLDASAKAIRR